MSLRGNQHLIITNHLPLSRQFSNDRPAGESRRGAAGLKERNGASRQCERGRIVWAPKWAFEAPAPASQGDCLAPGVDLMVNITQASTPETDMINARAERKKSGAHDVHTKRPHTREMSGGNQAIIYITPSGSIRQGT